MNTPAVRRLFVIGVLFWALAATAYGALRATFGPRPVYVHVRWAPDVSATERQRLEERHGLSEVEFREGTTWGYALVDRSRDNIRALVGDPAVEDTHHLHRTAFRVGYFSPRLSHLTPRAWIPDGLEILTGLSLVLGFICIGLGLLESVAPRAVRGPLLVLRSVFVEPRPTFARAASFVVAWVRSRIPLASAEAVAVFRIVFGSALLLFVLRRPVRASWAAEPTNVLSPPQELLLRFFTAAPSLVDWIAPWIVFWGALFIVGAAARIAFAMTTVGMLAWALVYTTQITHHTVVALLLTLLCLQWSRWSDAWSVDAWLRRTARRGTAQEYGYTSWVPALVLGVTFAAAAVAKLRESGLEWILNGTVKYHFLSDSGQAMVDWGLQYGQYHAVAVLLSFSAIAIETLVIAGVLSRQYRYRLMAGVASLSLVAGFSLFQGLFWPAWWILLLGFLPWHLVRPGAVDAIGAEIRRPAAVLVILALVGVQTVVSLFRLEVPPLMSTYDMYSTTYASPAEYLQKAGVQHWLMATDAAAHTHECRITRAEADVVAGTSPATDSGRSTVDVLRRCFAPSIQVKHLAIETSRPRVDWARWRMEKPERSLLTSVVISD